MAGDRKSSRGSRISRQSKHEMVLVRCDHVLVHHSWRQIHTAVDDEGRSFRAASCELQGCEELPRCEPRASRSSETRETAGGAGETVVTFWEMWLVVSCIVILGTRIRGWKRHRSGSSNVLGCRTG